MDRSDHSTSATAALFPGAVNTHTHTHLALLRGSVNELDLAGWLKAVYARVATFGPEDAYLGALLTFGEALLTGTTTTCDFFYLNGRGNRAYPSGHRRRARPRHPSRHGPYLPGRRMGR